MMAMDSMIEYLYRTSARQIYATLVRLLGDLDLAEEALQEAFASAVEKWPVDGIPENPRARLISVGRFQAINKVRRQAKFSASVAGIAARLEALNTTAPADHDVEDDRLRLIFTCCHPALAQATQIALTLR